MQVRITIRKPSVVFIQSSLCLCSNIGGCSSVIAITDLENQLMKWFLLDISSSFATSSARIKVFSIDKSFLLFSMLRLFVSHHPPKCSSCPGVSPQRIVSFGTLASSSQAPYHSLPCKHESSFISLLLLFPQNL